MAATDHLQTVRDLLVAAGFDGEHVYAGEEGKVAPDRAIFLSEAGGTSMPYMGVDYSDSEDVVQVTIKAPTQQQAREDMLVCKEALGARSPPGYVKVHRRAGPRTVGVDDDNRHVKSMDVTCEIIE